MFDKRLLKIAMAEKGLSKNQFALLLGITLKTLSAKIKNDGQFTHEEQEKMITLFGKKTALGFLYGLRAN
jgi:predicted transcriptional regulator